jgi:hypothetical protein
MAEGQPTHAVLKNSRILQTSTIHRELNNRTLAAAFVLVIIVSAGAGYFIGSSSTAGKANLTTTALTTTSESSSVAGLELKASINATTLGLGQRLGIAISLHNTLPALLNVSASDGWKVPGFPVSMWPLCYRDLPAEFMIVKGNYTLDALQAASVNATITPRSLLLCYGGHGNVEHFIFRSNSSEADLTGTFCTADCTPKQDFGSNDFASNFTVNGYWAYPFNSSEAWDVLTPAPPCHLCSPGVTFNFPEVGPIAQHVFTAGVFTLVATDEWGQVVILHFEVN